MALRTPEGLPFCPISVVAHPSMRAGGEGPPEHHALLAQIWRYSCPFYKERMAARAKRTADSAGTWRPSRQVIGAGGNPGRISWAGKSQIKPRCMNSLARSEKGVKAIHQRSVATRVKSCSVAARALAS